MVLIESPVIDINDIGMCIYSLIARKIQPNFTINFLPELVAKRE